jgi:hypothetical protein
MVWTRYVRTLCFVIVMKLKLKHGITFKLVRSYENLIEQSVK